MQFLTVLTTLLAYGAWHALRVITRVLNQPRHGKRPERRLLADDHAVEIEACAIAEANVRNCIELRHVSGGGSAHILCAGQRNFREPWARDFAFATFGLLEMNEAETVREGLEVFFRFQRPDGQLPVKVHSTDILERYLHSIFARHQPITAPLRPKYLTGHRTVSLDGNGLLTIAAANYVLESGDRDFLGRVAPGLTRALDWMERFAGADGLLRQGPYTDWADTVARTGVVLYTNVVYWKALDLVAQVCQSAPLRERADKLKNAIESQLWLAEEGYFATSPGLAILNSDGNTLAIAWGLVDDAKAGRILDAMELRKMSSPVPTRCTDRNYPRKWVAVENYLARIPHYHTSSAWMWLGGWHVAALLKAGRTERAMDLLHAMDRHVVQDGVVYEVYAPTGHPLETFWYQSEAPLTWNAAMLFYAHKMAERALA